VVGDIQLPDFLLAPENSFPLRCFLYATGLGHSAPLYLDGDYTTTYSTNDSDSDSLEPDFGAFETLFDNKQWRRIDGRLCSFFAGTLQILFML